MNKMAQGELVRWSPSRSAGVAILTELGMILSYIAIAQSGNNFFVMTVFVALVVPILTVGVPVCWATLTGKRYEANCGYS